MGFYQKVYDSVMKIPAGKVASYSQIAMLCGNPRAARAVGYALHKNPLPGVIPCHRVVNQFGRLAPAFAFGGEERQRCLLINEGVVFTKDGFVDMERCRWNETHKT
ncbi:MAG: MGMT family protein [Clostridiales bacterium]|nr:MGMT family protein [Clostridiales bacterium]